MAEHGTLGPLLQLLTAHSPELREGTVAAGLDTRLEELGIDSLELLSLSLDIEETFDIDIDDGDLNSAKSVADLVRIVDSVLRCKSA